MLIVFYGQKPKNSRNCPVWWRPDDSASCANQGIKQIYQRFLLRLALGEKTWKKNNSWNIQRCCFNWELWINSSQTLIFTISSWCPKNNNGMCRVFCFWRLFHQPASLLPGPPRLKQKSHAKWGTTTTELVNEHVDLFPPSPKTKHGYQECPVDRRLGLPSNSEAVTALDMRWPRPASWHGSTPTQDAGSSTPGSHAIFQGSGIPTPDFHLRMLLGGGIDRIHIFVHQRCMFFPVLEDLMIGAEVVDDLKQVPSTGGACWMVFLMDFMGGTCLNYPISGWGRTATKKSSEQNWSMKRSCFLFSLTLFFISTPFQHYVSFKKTMHSKLCKIIWNHGKLILRFWQNIWVFPKILVPSNHPFW